MSKHKFDWYVVYEVEGFDGTHRAGPYSEDEIRYQYNDIKGYEGVKNVRCDQVLKQDGGQ